MENFKVSERFAENVFTDEEIKKDSPKKPTRNSAVR